MTIFRNTTSKVITACILGCVDFFINTHKFVSEARDINNGLCGIFGKTVLNALEVTEVRCHYKNPLPSNQLVFLHMNINSIEDEEKDISMHWWLYYNGYHYDAECPEGVQSEESLPVFERMAL